MTPKAAVNKSEKKTSVKFESVKEFKSTTYLIKTNKIVYKANLSYLKMS